MFTPVAYRLGFVIGCGLLLLGLLPGVPLSSAAPPILDAIPPTSVPSSHLYTEAPTATSPSALRSPAEPDGTIIVRRSTIVDIPQITDPTDPNFPRSTMLEPSVGGQGNAILMTANTFAQISNNNGLSWQWIDPYQAFPDNPPVFARTRLCCDQRVAQDPNRNLVFWYLQYSPTGSTWSDTNGVRIAVFRGAGALTGILDYRLIEYTAAQFFPSQSGLWLDFPHMQVSANYLYFTSNVYEIPTNNFYKSLVARIPLDALASGGSFNTQYDTFDVGPIAPVNGVTVNSLGNSMYFASLSGQNALLILRWRDDETRPKAVTASGLRTTYYDFTCPGPAEPTSYDPCLNSDTRMQTGWASGSEVGFMWNSGRNIPAGRPYPFVRVAIFDRTSLDAQFPSAVLRSEPDLVPLNADYAFLFPTVAVNANGAVGGTVASMGGNRHPTVTAIIRDTLSSGNWDTGDVVIGYYTPVRNPPTSGNRWGDFMGATAHEKYPTTWLGGGYIWEPDSRGVPPGRIGELPLESFKPRPVNFWFFRSTDDPGLHAFDVNQCKQYTTVIPPNSKPILDLGTTTLDINVEDRFLVGRAIVSLYLYHAFDADLAAYMRSPSPRLVELLTYVGGSGDNMIPTHLSDYAQERPVTRGSPPFNNYYRSQYAVSQFYGQSASGTWQFQVRDNVANGQTGTLQAVYLNLCPTMTQFPTTVGVYRPSNSAFFLKNQNTGGPADIIAQYGLPQDLPVVGDWEDDGNDTIAVYRNGVFYIRFVNLGGPADLVVPFGVLGDLPVAGDWDGDGDDTVGVFRGGTWFMRNSNTQGPGEITLGFGLGGDIPVVGDWNGDSRDEVGVFRNGVFYLHISDSVVYTVPFGQAGDRPVAGDWDGDGLDTIGVYRNGAYYLRNSLTGGIADAVFAYGAVGDDPITGDWDFRK